MSDSNNVEVNAVLYEVYISRPLPMSLHLSAKLLVQEIPEMNIPLAKKILGELEENRPTLAYVGNAAESGRVTGTLLAFNFAVSHKRI